MSEFLGANNMTKATEPSHGIFWVLAETETELTAQNIFCVAEAYSENGDKTIFNHKRVWQTVERKVTNGKPYNYYPRGRVEIKNGKATVWLNGNILHLSDEIIKIFALSTLSQVRIKEDGSEHYKCHFDW